MSKSPLSSKSVHHSSGNVQVSSKLASKPQTLRWYENLCPPKIWAAKELFASACMAIGQQYGFLKTNPCLSITDICHSRHNIFKPVRTVQHAKSLFLPNFGYFVVNLCKFCVLFTDCCGVPIDKYKVSSFRRMMKASQETNQNSKCSKQSAMHFVNVQTVGCQKSVEGGALFYSFPRHQ